MTLCFELSMPSNNSWNGKWSGEGNCYAKIVKFSDSKKGKEVTDRILKDQPYYYGFDDGWAASVSAKEVRGDEIRKKRKKSRGFCGYDWMVDNIRFYGSPYGKQEEVKTNGESVSVGDS